MKIPRAPLLLLVVAVVVAGCGVATPEAVTIALVAPQAGERAWLGQEMRAGAEMAVDALNDDGGLLGHPVELLVVDDTDLVTLPGQLADVAERSRASVVIGPEAPAVILGDRSPLTRRQVPVVLASAFGGDLADASTPTFRTIPSAHAQARAMGRWMTRVRGIDRLSLLVADPVEGGLVTAALRRGLAQEGVEVVHVTTADPGAADLRPAVSALRAAAPDVGATWLWAAPEVAARATLAVRDLGWDPQVVVGTHALVGSYRTVAGPATEGVVAPFPYRDRWFSQGADLFAWMLRYHTRNGIGVLAQLDTLVLDLPVVALTTHEAVNLVAEAARAADSRAPDDLAAALSSLEWDGLLIGYDLENREAFAAEDLHVARFHELAFTFDVDPRLDPARQRWLWNAQVTLDVLPEELEGTPLGDRIAELVGTREAPTYRPPLPAPGPVGRP